jgi:hypothetical protein
MLHVEVVSLLDRDATGVDCARGVDGWDGLEGDVVGFFGWRRGKLGFGEGCKGFVVGGEVRGGG